MAQGCWHGRPLGRVIHTQNITFTKAPGQNIRGELVESLWVGGRLMRSFISPVRITHNLPSGRYQVVQSSFFYFFTIIQACPKMMYFHLKIFDRWRWCPTVWKEVSWLPLLHLHAAPGEIFPTSKIPKLPFGQPKMPSFLLLF